MTCPHRRPRPRPSRKMRPTKTRMTRTIIGTITQRMKMLIPTWRDMRMRSGMKARTTMRIAVGRVERAMRIGESGDTDDPHFGSYKCGPMCMEGNAEYGIVERNGRYPLPALMRFRTMLALAANTMQI